MRNLNFRIKQFINRFDNFMGTRPLVATAVLVGGVALIGFALHLEMAALDTPVTKVQSQETDKKK